MLQLRNVSMCKCGGGCRAISVQNGDFRWSVLFLFLFLSDRSVSVPTFLRATQLFHTEANRASISASSALQALTKAGRMCAPCVLHASLLKPQRGCFAAQGSCVNRRVPFGEPHPMGPLQLAPYPTTILVSFVHSSPSLRFRFERPSVLSGSCGKAEKRFNRYAEHHAKHHCREDAPYCSMQRATCIICSGNWLMASTFSYFSWTRYW